MFKELILSIVLTTCIGVPSISLSQTDDQVVENTVDIKRASQNVSLSDLVPQRESSFDCDSISGTDTSLDNLSFTYYYPSAQNASATWNSSWGTYPTLVGDIRVDYMNTFDIDFLDTPSYVNLFDNGNSYYLNYNGHTFRMFLSFQINFDSFDDSLCIWTGFCSEFHNGQPYYYFIHKMGVNNSNNILTERLQYYRLKITDCFYSYDSYGVPYSFRDEMFYYDYHSLIVANNANPIVAGESYYLNGNDKPYLYFSIEIVNPFSNQGTTEDFVTGYDIGYADGFEVGSSSSSSLVTLFLTIADIPFNMLHSMFNFDVLGVSLFLGIMGIATIALVLWVVRKFI